MSEESPNASVEAYRDRLRQRGLAALQHAQTPSQPSSSLRSPLEEKVAVPENLKPALWLPAGDRYWCDASAPRIKEWQQPQATPQAGHCESCFRSQHALAEAKVAQARALQQTSEAQAAASAAQAALASAEAALAAAEERAQKAEAQLALKAKESSRWSWAQGEAEEEELSLQMPMDGSIRCFLQVKESFSSEVSGYLSASQHDELVAVHAKDEWYYGFHLFDTKRCGWFERVKVERQ